MLVQNLGYCGGTGNSNSRTSAWVMVSNQAESANGYAQAGIIELPGCGPAPFWEVEISAGNGFNIQQHACGSYAAGHTHRMQVQWDPGNGYFDFLRDGVKFGNGSFNPFQVWSYLFGWQLLGETHVDGDDVPGTSPNSSQTQWPNIQWENYSNAFSGSKAGNITTVRSEGRWGLNGLRTSSCCGYVNNVWAS